jgi:hypothetical protein
MNKNHYAISDHPIDGKYRVMINGGEMSKAEAQAAADRKNIEIGEKDDAVIKDITFQVSFYDGEYLSGYTIYGEAAKELEVLGLAHYVSGWGYHVRDEVVKTLGSSFTHAQAVEYSRPARMAKVQAAYRAKADRQAKFDEAARTGHKALLDQYTDDCNDPKEECSLDIVTVYAMPDGSTQTHRSHTW